MTQRVCGFIVVLLIVSVTVPVLGKNYLLHSPKLWSPQEKEQFEKENPPVKNENDQVENEKQKEQAKKDKELAEKQKEQVKRDKELADKQKEQARRDKELTEKQKEQLRKDKELSDKQKEQAKRDKELAEKQKEQTKRDRELTEKQKEQIRRDRELAEKQKDQGKKDKEQVEKQRDQLKKDKEHVEKQKDQLKRDKELADKQAEHVKKEKEQIEKLKEQVKKDKENIKKEKDKIKKEKARIKKNQILVQNGVSYREVTVEKGDTLYSISRKYSKQGSSYAEILRFNDIANPNKIVNGDVIKVPLFQEKEEKQGVSRPLAATPVKVLDVEKKTNRFEQELNQLSQPVVALSPVQAPSISAQKSLPQQPVFSNNSSSGQKLFEQAVKSYRAGDCQSAIQLFGRFLAEHTGSVLSADASLFVADCYLKLSVK